MTPATSLACPPALARTARSDALKPLQPAELRRLLAIGALMLVAAGLATPVRAQVQAAAQPQPAAPSTDFPTRPIELTVLFPAGSSSDVVARLLASSMAKHLGQNVVVMNRPGAGGAIGYKYVQGQKPDGYNIVFNSTSVSTVHYTGLTPFDYRAFDPVARVSIELPVVAVRADAPWKTLGEMLDAARAKPDTLKMGNSGTGSHTHISAEAFMAEQKLQVVHVPFASAQVITSLLGGHIDALVQLPAALAPHVKAGTVRILGTLASTREPIFPDVPTATEQGFPFQADLWRGLAVPKGTPPVVVARLEDAARKAINGPEFREQGARLGYVPAFQGASDFGKTIASDDAQMAKLMTRVGLKLQ